MYARIHNGAVVEICVPIEGFTIEQCFHPDLVDKMVSCLPEVQAGWTYNEETGEFTAPQIN
jgi:hypothetical protein